MYGMAVSTLMNDKNVDIHLRSWCRMRSPIVEVAQAAAMQRRLEANPCCGIHGRQICGRGRITLQANRLPCTYTRDARIGSEKHADLCRMAQPATEDVQVLRIFTESQYKRS
jgi:hypothetical protein